MAGRQRQMRRDKRGGTQIAAGGFHLANSLPRPTGGIHNGLTLVVAEEKRALLVAQCGGGAGQRDHRDQ